MSEEVLIKNFLFFIHFSSCFRREIVSYYLFSIMLIITRFPKLYAALYSVGVLPVFRLKKRTKCCG